MHRAAACTGTALVALALCFALPKNAYAQEDDLPAIVEKPRARKKVPRNLIPLKTGEERVLAPNNLTLTDVYQVEGPGILTVSVTRQGRWPDVAWMMVKRGNKRDRIRINRAEIVRAFDVPKGLQAYQFALRPASKLAGEVVLTFTPPLDETPDLLVAPPSTATVTTRTSTTPRPSAPAHTGPATRVEDDAGYRDQLRSLVRAGNIDPAEITLEIKAPKGLPPPEVTLDKEPLTLAPESPKRPRFRGDIVPGPHVINIMFFCESDDPDSDEWPVDIIGEQRFLADAGKSLRLVATVTERVDPSATYCQRLGLTMDLIREGELKPMAPAEATPTP